MKLFTFVQAAQTGPGLQPKLQSPGSTPGRPAGPGPGPEAPAEMRTPAALEPQP